MIIANERTLPQKPGQNLNFKDCLNNESLDHVFHPFRLIVYKNCVKVSGIVSGIDRVPDGDYKFGLTLDPQYRWTLNFGNKLAYQDKLVVEIVCVGKITESAPKKACGGFKNNVYLPKNGERVTVIGQHVLDTTHLWNEIHPVYNISVE